MGNHHDNNHSNEKKPVAFAVPFYLALVVLTAILSLVSLGNPCCGNEECCKEKCEKECKKEGGAKEGHGGHEGAAKEEAPKSEGHGH